MLPFTHLHRGNSVTLLFCSSGAFSVECRMDENPDYIITLVHHDTETRFYVTGYNAIGSYRRDITYYGATTTQVIKVRERSLFCKQSMTLECYGASTTNDDWLIDADGQKVLYHRNEGDCRCLLDRACHQGSTRYVPYTLTKVFQYECRETFLCMLPGSYRCNY